jgi:plastocyanin
MRVPRSRLASLLLFVPVALLSACDDNSSGEGDENLTGVSTITRSVPNASVTGSPVAAGTGAAASGGGGKDVDLTATDNDFSRDEITIRDQESITLTFKNEGKAAHNWHLLGVTDPNGDEPRTPMVPGGEEETITFFVAQAGTYAYQCDAFPNEMRGRLVVE